MRSKLYQCIFVIIFGIVLPSVLLVSIPRKSVNKAVMDSHTQPVHSSRIKVLNLDGCVTEIELEEYVLGVVLAEMPADFESDALMAQAVLARTYAQKRADGQYKHSNAPVCTDSACCQGFVSLNDYTGDKRSLSKVAAAVEATKGQVLMYEGKLIDATYFSCSGGRTEDAVAVWGTDVPYLKATDSPGEENSSQYLSTVILNQEDCLRKLDLPDRALRIGEVKYTDGGGVDTICLCDKVFNGVQVRQLLSLKSTNFRMNLVGNNVVITVKGYGHRVGLSQYGANAMATEGYKYDQILSHYYHGTELVTKFG